MRLRGISLLLALASTSALAADREGNYAVWGSGAKSCNNYNQMRKEENDAEFRSYAMGYLTAYNTFVPDTYRIGGNLDFKGIMAMVDDYCQRSQLDSFERALKLTVEELAPTRQKTPPRSHRPGW